MSPTAAVLIPLFTFILFISILAITRLGHTLRDSEHESFRAANPELLRLRDEKVRLLQTIQDLEHEFALGKLSEADYQHLRHHFEQETLNVLQALDHAAAQEVPS